MVSAPKVVEDDRESRQPRGSRPALGWLVVGLVLGAGLTVLVLRPGPSGEAVTSTTTATASDAASEGIADVIEGFPDGLAAITRSDGQSLELLVWPVGGEPIERTIPVGVSRPPGPVEFDVSARRIATLLPVPEQVDGILYAGVPQDAAIIATDVTGYAWHDTGPSQLAYSTFVDDELQIWAVHQGNGVPELVTRAVGIDGRVEAWGDWGFAVQDDARDSIVLFTPTGEIKDTKIGRILDSVGTGWLAVDNQGVGLLSAGGGVRMLPAATPSEAVLAGRFSDDGQRLALLTAEGIHVVPVEDGGPSLQSDARPGVPQLAWSSDGRFVAYPGSRGIWVVDIRGETVDVLTNRTFTGLEMLPVGES